MALLHKVIDDCIKQLRKVVYSVQPAAVNGMGARWHAHNKDGGSMADAGEKVRLFDVVLSPGALNRASSIGTTEQDYDTQIDIIIGYGMHEDYIHLAYGDYDAIQHAIYNAKVSDVAGLQCYNVGPMTIEDFEDARFARIPVITLISAGRS